MACGFSVRGAHDAAASLTSPPAARSAPPAVGLLRDFYDDCDESAVVMEWRVPLDDRLPDQQGGER